jgi:ribosomal-protein-serine acetyltransferase
MNFDHFTIRQLTTADAPAYFKLVDANRERIARYFPLTSQSTSDLNSTIQLVTERMVRAEKKEFITYIIVDNETQALIGSIFIKDMNWHVGKGELAFFINKEHEGKGLISKTVALVVNECFNYWKLNKVYMRIAEENISSRRVAEKNGFTVEGVLKEDFKTNKGELIDVVYYGLLKKNQIT